MSSFRLLRKYGPLYIVRSRKLIVVIEQECVNLRLGWNMLRSDRKLSIVSFSDHSRKISSTYLAKSIGVTG